MAQHTGLPYEARKAETRVYNARRELDARADRLAIRRFGLLPGMTLRSLTTRGMFGINEYTRVKIVQIWQGTRVDGEGYRKGGRTRLQLEIEPRNIVNVTMQGA